MKKKLKKYGKVKVGKTDKLTEIIIKGFDNKMSNVTEVINIIKENETKSKIKGFAVAKGIFRITLKD